MTNLTEVKREIDKLAQTAKSNYEKFKLSLPKTNDAKQSSNIQKSLNVLQKLQNPNIIELYNELRTVIDPKNEHADEDITTRIASLKDEEKKTKAATAYKILARNTKDINNMMNEAIQYLQKNSLTLDPSQHKLYQTTHQYLALKDTILHTNLIPALKQNENTPLIDAHRKMEKAHQEMQELANNDQALRTSGNHEGAIALLKEKQSNYLAYEQKYKALLLEHRSAHDQLEAETIKFNELNTALGDLLKKLPKEDPGTYNARDYQKTLNNKKFDTDLNKEFSYIDRIPLIHSRIMQENKTIENMIAALETKYQEDLKKTQTSIQQHTQHISQNLTTLGGLMTDCSTYLSRDFIKQFEKTYSSMQQKNLNILKQAMDEDVSLHATLPLVNEAKTLDTTMDTWAKNVEAQIHYILMQHYTKQITTLQSGIKKEKKFDGDLSFQIPVAADDAKTMGIDKLVHLIQDTEKQLSDIKEINAILHGFKNGHNDSLQKYLNSHTTPKRVFNLLEEVMKQSNAEQLNGALVNVQFSELDKSVIEEIRRFISLEHVSSSQSAQPIKEKLTCYDELQSLNNSSIEMKHIDKPTFRQAFLFLQEKGMSANEAYSLTATQENLNPILAIKKHLQDIRKDEIQGLLSSNIKTAAFNLIISQRWKNSAPLINELATNEPFAEAVLKLKDKELLFNQNFLLTLANSNEDIKTPIIQALNSESSEEYQTVLKHLVKLNEPNNLSPLALYINNEGQQQSIPITQLKNIFNAIERMFTDLSKSEEKNVPNKLQVTKECIFDHFMQAANLDQGFKQSIATISDNFKDNRRLLQKIVDGLTNILKTISHWWNKTEKPQSLNKKDLISTFKTSMQGIRKEECPTNPEPNKSPPRLK